VQHSFPKEHCRVCTTRHCNGPRVDSERAHSLLSPCVSPLGVRACAGAEPRADAEAAAAAAGRCHGGAGAAADGEESPVWVNLHDCLTPLHKGSGAMRGSFIWASERTGFRHLYMYDGRGRCLGALTEGDGWMVEQVVGVDESSQTILLQRHPGLAPGDPPVRHPLGPRGPHALRNTPRASTPPRGRRPPPPPPLCPRGRGRGRGSLRVQEGSAGSTFASSWVATIGLRRLTQGKGRHSVIFASPGTLPCCAAQSRERALDPLLACSSLPCLIGKGEGPLRILTWHGLLTHARLSAKK